MKSIFKRTPFRYMIIVKQKENSDKENRVFYYNTGIAEILQDAYWALKFIDADRITIRSTKNRKKILAEIHNVKEWRKLWIKMFGNNANYFVWKDRH